MLGELEYQCALCRGTGNIADEPCWKCEGYGGHLSDKGKQLVEFLQRRGVVFGLSPLAENELRGMVE